MNENVSLYPSLTGVFSSDDLCIAVNYIKRYVGSTAKVECARKYSKTKILFIVFW